MNSLSKDEDEFDPSLMAISFGIKYELYNNIEKSLNIASSYRIGMIDDLNTGLTTGIPDKLSLGLNYNDSIGTGSLSLSAEYDITYIGGVTYYEDGPNDESSFGDTTTIAFGAEYAMQSFILRAGYSQSDIARTYDDNWNSTIISFGIAFPYDNDIVEASIEKRSYDFNQVEGVEESTLLTLSYHFSKVKK
jgi:predicted porin